MSDRVQVECLGSGKRRLEKAIRTAAQACSKAQVAVAYAQSDQAKKLTKWLGDAECDVIVGVSDLVTAPEALAHLYNRARQQGQFHAFYAGDWRLGTTEPLFHVKLMVFHGPDSSVVFCGSANLTRGGWRSNNEIVMRLEAKADCGAISSATAAFNDLPRKELTASVVGGYRKARKAREHPVADGAFEVQVENVHTGNPYNCRLLPSAGDLKRFPDACPSETFVLVDPLGREYEAYCNWKHKQKGIKTVQAIWPKDSDPDPYRTSEFFEERRIDSSMRAWLRERTSPSRFQIVAIKPKRGGPA